MNYDEKQATLFSCIVGLGANIAIDVSHRSMKPIVRSAMDVALVPISPSLEFIYENAYDRTHLVRGIINARCINIRDAPARARFQVRCGTIND